VLKKGARIVNINAGLDEFSGLLIKRFPEASLNVFDFYDPEKHTEVSIKRARKTYPPYPGTISISTTSLPLVDDTADLIILALAAHEIRDTQERILFFSELRRALRPDGSIVVTEHLRDFPNFLAYTVGAFHFLPRASWLRVFQKSGLQVRAEVKSTPFISTFMLTKNGAES
jgi:SAM-dependent methyltransferase